MCILCVQLWTWLCHQLVVFQFLCLLSLYMLFLSCLLLLVLSPSSCRARWLHLQRLMLRLLWRAWIDLDRQTDAQEVDGIHDESPELFYYSVVASATRGRNSWSLWIPGGPTGRLQVWISRRWKNFWQKKTHIHVCLSPVCVLVDEA